jgi:hypothetical protein
MCLIEEYEAPISSCGERGRQKWGDVAVSEENRKLILVIEEDDGLGAAQGNRGEQLFCHLQVTALDDLRSHVEDYSHRRL